VLRKASPSASKTPPYWTKDFPNWVQEFAAMFTLILGKDNDFYVDEAPLIILNHFHNHQTPSYCYVETIATNMREQLANFSIVKFFRYPSYLVCVHFLSAWFLNPLRVTTTQGW
jgi:hypothetical protein